MHIITPPWTEGRHTICTSPCHLMFNAHSNKLPTAETEQVMCLVYGPGSLKQDGLFLVVAWQLLSHTPPRALIGMADILLRRSHPPNKKKKKKKNAPQQTEIDPNSARQPAGTADPCTELVCHARGQTPSGPGDSTKQDRWKWMDVNKTSSAPAFHLNSASVTKINDFSGLFFTFLLCSEAEKAHIDFN